MSTTLSKGTKPGYFQIGSAPQKQKNHVKVTIADDGHLTITGLDAKPLLASTALSLLINGDTGIAFASVNELRVFVAQYIFVLPSNHGLQTYADSAFDKVQTSATGANFVTLPAYQCDGVTIFAGPQDVAVKKNGAGVEVTVSANTKHFFSGITNAKQLSLRRGDSSNTQVYVSFENVVKQY